MVTKIYRERSIFRPAPAGLFNPKRNTGLVEIWYPLGIVKLSIVGILLSLLCNFSYALEIGDKVPELSILKWLKGGPVAIFPNNENVNKRREVFVVFFWTTWEPSAKRMLAFVEKESMLFKDASVTFVGISKEHLTKVKSFLKGIPNISFSIGVDDKASTYDKYMVGTKGPPLFFIIGRNAKLLWKGRPFELDNVLSRVVSGTFNIERQNSIETLRGELGKYSQTFNYNKIFELSGEILKIDPSDEIALNVAVDYYIRKKQIKKAIELVETARKKAGINKYLQRNLYLIELSIIRGMDITKAKIALHNLAKAFYGTFYNNPRFLVEFSDIIMQNIPFEIRPLNELLKMTERAVSLGEKYNQQEQPHYLQTLARMYACVGCFSKAINIQNQAAKLLKNKKEKQVALLKKVYYQKLFKINQIIK